MLTLSSVSSGLKFLSVNHTLIHKNSEIKVFIEIYDFSVKYQMIDRMIYQEQTFARLLNHVDNYC